MPENVRNDLLVKLADNKEADKAVAKILKQYFDKLPNIIRNELTRKLEKKIVEKILTLPLRVVEYF